MKGTTCWILQKHTQSLNQRHNLPAAHKCCTNNLLTTITTALQLFSSEQQHAGAQSTLSSLRAQCQELNRNSTAAQSQTSSTLRDCHQAQEEGDRLREELRNALQAGLRVRQEAGLAEAQVRVGLGDAG